MKCFVIFNSLPDISYLWMDKEFRSHIINKGISLINPEMKASDVDEETILSLVVQFFNPMVNSNKYMREVNNAYQTMKCDNGFIFVMNQLTELSLFCIAVCGDGQESELFLQRKINFFHRMLIFSYGPCAVDHLRPPFPDKRRKAWRELDRWLSSWTTLCQQEQMYLVEALERLHVNHQLNSISLNLLGEILAKSNRDSTMHTLLLVNNKVLGLYSNQRSLELQSADILLLIVLINKSFQYVDELVPKSIYRTPEPLVTTVQQCTDELLFKRPPKETKSSSTERDSSASPANFEYHSAPSTPVEDHGFKEGFFTPRNSTVFTPIQHSEEIPRHRRSSSSSLQDRFSTPSVSMDGDRRGIDYDLTMSDVEVENLFSNEVEDDQNHEKKESNHSNNASPSTLVNHHTEIDETDTGSEALDSQQHQMNQEDIEDQTPTNSKIEEKEEDLDEDTEEEIEVLEDIIHHNIFLKSSAESSFAPYTAHCLLLSNATVLVLLSQHRHMFLAFYIQNMLRCLNLILVITKQKQLSYRMKLFDDCEKYRQKIQLFFLRTSGYQTNRMGNYYKGFEQKWNATQDAGLLDFINSDTPSVEMNARLEQNLVNLIKSTKALFTQSFISNDGQSYMDEGQTRLFRSLRDIAVERLSHYNLFLNVRGQQNVSMTAYHNDFPGLVHFIYTNRTTDQLVAPTVNVNIDSNNSLYNLIKQRIWDYWQYSETMLSKGYTSFMLRDGDFCYSYFIWFEDSLRKPMLSQKSMKGLNENKPTGILSGNYYKDLMCHLFPSEPKGSINCYELFCVHVGLVSNQYVASSCKKLSRKLEGSGEIVVL